MVGERAVPGRLRPRKEDLEERIKAGGRRQEARPFVDLDEGEVRGDLEIRRRELDDAFGLGLGLRVIDDPGEEIHPDRQGRRAAGLPLPERDGLVVADPDAGAQVRREADEPGVRIFVGRPRLAGQRPAEDRSRPGRPAFPLDDAAHEVGHHVGGLRRDDLLGFDPRLFEDVAVLVLDPADEIGLEADALVGIGRVRRDHLEQGDLEGPQAEREIRVDRRGDAEAPAVVDADLRRDEIEELRRDDVPGLLEAGPDGDGALVLPVVVLGRPGFVAPAVDEGHRLVGDDAGRGEAVLDGGGVEEGLDGRARLPRRLDGPVELAVAEGIAADEGPDLPGLRVDDHHGAVPQGLLVERDAGLFGLGVEGGDLDLDDVAALEDRVEAAGLRPADVLGGHQAHGVLDPDRGFAAGDREDDGVVDPGRLERLVLPGQEPVLLQRGLGGGDEVLEGLGTGGEDVRLVGPPAVQRVLRPAQARLQGRLGIALKVRIDGREDLEPGPVKAVKAVGLLEVAADLLEEVGPEFRARPPLGQDLHRLGLERLALGLRQVALRDHPVEDVVAAVEGPRLVRVRGVDRRPPEDPGDDGRLLEVEVRDVLAEEVVGRRLDAVDAVAEEEVVAVELEDLFLGVELFDLARQIELLELAPEADLPVQEERAGQLLGDRAAALGPLAAEDLEHVGPDGPEDAAKVDAAVAEEARVLRRDDGVDEGLGDPVIGDLDAPLLGELLDRPAVRGVDRGDELGPEGVDIGDLGQVVLDGDIGAGQGPQADGQAGQDEDEERPEDRAFLELLDLDLEPRDVHGVNTSS